MNNILQKIDFHFSSIHSYLHKKLLPKLMSSSFDSESGRAYESFSKIGEPSVDSATRLLVQCRLLYTMSQAYIDTGVNNYLSAAKKIFAYLEKYRDPNGPGFFSALDCQGEVFNRSKESYAHAFLILSLASYCKACNDFSARNALSNVTAFVQQDLWDMKYGGYFDSINERLEKKQNPLMHMLEAYIAAYELNGDPNFLAISKSLVELFSRHIFDTSKNVVFEYFHQNWSPIFTHAQHIEPGHHFEWYWLLNWYEYAVGLSTSEMRERIFFWALENGIDHTEGGVYDVVSPEGNCISSNKRIWPLLELIKALATLILQPPFKSKQSDFLEMLNLNLIFLQRIYLREDGLWHEHVNKAGHGIREDSPLSTSYHLYLGCSVFLKSWRVYRQK